MIDQLPSDKIQWVYDILDEDIEMLAAYSSTWHPSSVRKILAAYCYEKCTELGLFVHIRELREIFGVKKKGYMKFHTLVRQDLLHSQQDRFTSVHLLPAITPYLEQLKDHGLLNGETITLVVQNCEQRIQLKRYVLKNYEYELPLLLAVVGVLVTLPKCELKEIVEALTGEKSHRLIPRIKQLWLKIK